jgi:hypothetical protein
MPCAAAGGWIREHINHCTVNIRNLDFYLAAPHHGGAEKLFAGYASDRKLLFVNDLI